MEKLDTETAKSEGPDEASNVEAPDVGAGQVEALEMKPSELCDVCGGAVPAEEAVKAELSAADAMCPTPMTFHKACYEQASRIWQPDPDSYCTTDPDFPETQQWTIPADPVQQARG